MSNQDQSITIPFNPVMNRGTVIIGSPETEKNIFSFLPMIESGITQSCQ